MSTENKETENKATRPGFDLGLNGKVALVTAGSKGLGRSSALSLAKNGAKVMITGRTKKDLDAAVALIGGETGRPEDIIAMAGDATDQKHLDAVFKAIIDKWGQLDILIANCGGPKPGKYVDLTPEDFEGATNLTFMSFVRACYTVTPHMRKRGTGSIVTIQSVSIKQGIDTLVLSNSVRMAVVGLVRSMATELGPVGIRVNTIAPGLHQTDRLMNNFKKRGEGQGKTLEEVAKGVTANVPLRRINDPDNFGENVAWLASPASSYITGQCIFVDGGSARFPL